MREIWSLFSTFFIIGSIAFGGGYAVLPILMREIVQKRQWLSEDELLDYFAVSQATPGVICVNISTFMGYRKKGFIGAAAATVGVVLPSLIIITAIAAVLSNFSDI
ncbi:MAG: chromate transporter, partial [Clostridiales bacterium]|nr:chromate transporter [Clostridiales bacterium]